MGNEQSAPYNLPTNNMNSEKNVYPIKTTSNNKKPQPFVGSFFDAHLAPIVPHKQATKPNRPAGHVNFFEVAAVTVEPVSTKSNTSSATSSSNNKKSSIKSASVKSASIMSASVNKSSYPTTISSKHQLKKYNSNMSATSSMNSSLSSTTGNESKSSIASEYITINGRRYWKAHGSQKFILPCDDEENDRSMMMHYILKSKFHGNFRAPIQKKLESEKRRTKVLDIGCGSGTWILEMASEYPNTEFFGVNDCPLFPTSIKPGNVHFKSHNVLKGLPYKDDEFDLVHMRLMVMYFSPQEIAKLIEEICRVMKPGGYFEVIDTNYVIRNAGPISEKYINAELRNALDVPSSSYESKTNHPIFTYLMLAPQQIGSSFKAGSLIDITQEHSTLPLGGSWGGGQIGDLHGKNFRGLLSCIQSATDGSLSLSKKSVDSILDECEQHQSYLDWFSCYARKPLSDDQLEQSTLDSIYEFVEGFVDA